jgi:hypothetical protein
VLSHVARDRAPRLVTRKSASPQPFFPVWDELLIPLGSQQHPTGSTPFQAPACSILHVRSYLNLMPFLEGPSWRLACTYTHMLLYLKRQYNTRVPLYSIKKPKPTRPPGAWATFQLDVIVSTLDQITRNPPKNATRRKKQGGFTDLIGGLEPDIRPHSSVLINLFCVESPRGSCKGVSALAKLPTRPVT